MKVVVSDLLTEKFKTELLDEFVDAEFVFVDGENGYDLVLRGYAYDCGFLLSVSKRPPSLIWLQSRMK